MVGVPQETGLFNISLSISSGNLSATQDFQLRVNAPVPEVDRLVDQPLVWSAVFDARRTAVPRPTGKPQRRI